MATRSAKSSKAAGCGAVVARQKCVLFGGERFAGANLSEQGRRRTERELDETGAQSRAQPVDPCRRPELVEQLRGGDFLALPLVEQRLLRSGKIGPAESGAVPLPATSSTMRQTEGCRPPIFSLGQNKSRPFRAAPRSRRPLAAPGAGPHRWQIWAGAVCRKSRNRSESATSNSRRHFTLRAAGCCCDARKPAGAPPARVEEIRRVR